MENALLIGLSRQVALARELDVIANNMANVGTNGFKARSARFNEFLMPVAKADAFKPADRPLSYVIDKGTPLDLSQGTIEMTGNPLDVALKGDNYLVVQTPNGERYTRAGSLNIDRQGRLVTQTGLPVMGEAGPITFGSSEHSMRIAADGTVSSDQGTRGKLRQVRFADPKTLANEGTNLFSSTTPPQAAGLEARMEPGAIERSNVNVTEELVGLIAAQRNFQANAKAIEGASTLTQTIINMRT